MSLVSNAQALLDLDKDGALVPHGIGGHARTIISEFIAEDARLQSRIEELERAQTWQPIETASRDGTHIIGLTRSGAREVWWKRDIYEGEFWQDENDSEPEPSHWVPLPSKARSVLEASNKGGE